MSTAQDIYGDRPFHSRYRPPRPSLRQTTLFGALMILSFKTIGTRGRRTFIRVSAQTAHSRIQMHLRRRGVARGGWAMVYAMISAELRSAGSTKATVSWDAS